jgi:Holliday junction resolvasome RuvABC endonuclease subunit
MFAGFDLGGNTGYAFLDAEGNRIRSGTLSLGKRCQESIEKLYCFFNDFLINAIFVGYEKVTFFSKGFKASHAYGSYEAILWHVCSKYELNPEMIHVATLKKASTGDGKATKDDMEAFIWSIFKYTPYDDNEADAICIAHYFYRKYMIGDVLDNKIVTKRKKLKK